MGSFAEYAAAGWRLCAIDRGRKSPTYDGWNTTPIPADAVPGLDGAGLLHALSGTCAVDIDDLSAARPWLAARGIDVDALLGAPDAVRIDSGRPGRAKLLYRLKRPLRTLKPKGSGLELRCATADGKSVQDVLPPTIHPDTGKPYRWAYGEPLIGDWRALPAIPAALLALWRELAGAEPAAAAGTAPAASPAATATLVQLRKLVEGRDPDCAYDDWIRVGMALHHETGGAAEGLALWDEWSRRGKKYKGEADLRVHWFSFQSTPGKRVATVASLRAETAAAADEFEVIPVEPPSAPPPADSTAAAMLATAGEKLKAAREALEQRLIFVYTSEGYFDTERHQIISGNSIEHLFTHTMPKGKQGRVSPLKVLKESATKRVVDGLAFHPGEGVVFRDPHTGDQFANIYRNRLPTPLEPTAGERERLEWLFARITDPKFRTYLLRFFGHVVQRPGVKIKSAPLIWSETTGNGKTTLLRMLPSLLVGAEYSREVTASLLVSDFNDYLLNAWHVNLTEFRAGTRGERLAISSKLKAWITDESIALHPKGQAAYTMPNHFFVTATSNEDDAAAIDNNDRRWAVHEMEAPQFTDAEQHYLYHEFLLTPRAPGVLRHYFLHTDISGFNPSAKAIETDARTAMIAASVSSDVEALMIAFEQRTHPLDRDVVLAHEVQAWIHKHTLARPSALRVARLLSNPPFSGHAVQFRVGESRYRAIILRNYTHWRHVQGKQILAHINGEDIDIAV